MLLSVPPRTGINPYNGYTGKNNKKVNNSPAGPASALSAADIRSRFDAVFCPSSASLVKKLLGLLKLQCP